MSQTTDATIHNRTVLEFLQQYPVQTPEIARMAEMLRAHLHEPHIAHAIAETTPMTREEEATESGGRG